MKYTVLCLASLKQLEWLVNKEIENGWRPLGGIAASSDPEGKDRIIDDFGPDSDIPSGKSCGTIWAQAMIKENVTKIEKKTEKRRTKNG